MAKLLKYQDYDEYKSAQIEANVRKFTNVFAETNELRRVAEDFGRRTDGKGFGLCHGVRNGYEVRFLRSQLPGLDVIGTDISPTIEKVPNAIQWDMHETKPEWIGNTDFIYSNSWDHTYDPELLFERWASCLSSKGRLYVAFTEKHTDAGVTETSKYDAFGCSLGELVTILQKRLQLEDVLEIQPHRSWKTLRRRFAYARAGKFGAAFGASVVSHRIILLVLKRN